jgi:hypothetical protein
VYVDVSLHVSPYIARYVMYSSVETFSPILRLVKCIYVFADYLMRKADTFAAICEPIV